MKLTIITLEVPAIYSHYKWESSTLGDTSVFLLEVSTDHRQLFRVDRFQAPTAISEDHREALVKYLFPDGSTLIKAKERQILRNRDWWREQKHYWDGHRTLKLIGAS